MNVEKENPQQELAACLYIKLLNSFQSIFILGQRGLESDSKAILRVALEGLFLLKIISEDENFIKEYLVTDLMEIDKTLEIISNDKDHLIFTEELKNEFPSEVF